MSERSRNTLHVGKLREFDLWMAEQGYVRLRPPANATFEVVRWRGEPGRPMPIVFYQIGRNKEHYTTNSECTRLVKKWLRERKENNMNSSQDEGGI